MQNEPREQLQEMTTALSGTETTPSAAKNPLLSLWRRKWIAIACAIIGLVLGYVMFATSDPIYEGRAKILISQTGPKLLQQDFPGSLATGQMWLATQCDLIRSTKILGDVAPYARDLPMFRTNPQLASNILGYLQGATVARQDKPNSELVSVSVRGPNSNDTAALANLVVESYERFNDELKKTSASAVLKLLGEQKQKNEDELDDKIAERLKFQQDNSSLSFNREVRNPILEKVNQLSTALTNAEIQKMSAQAEYDAVKTMLDSPEKIRQLINSSQYRGESFALRRELREMQYAMEALSGTYLPGSTAMAAKAQRMQRTKEELEAEEKAQAQAILADIERRYNAAKLEAEQCQIFLNEQQSQVLGVNVKQAEFDKIEAEIARLTRYGEQLSDQMKSISLAESTGAMNVHIVEPAKGGGGPVEPNLFKLLFMGLAGGSLVGVGLALLAELLDQRLRSADEIKQVVGLPIVGVVPHILSGRNQSERSLIVNSEPMSDVAEAYRTVRTAVYFGVRGEAIKTLLVTSPAPGDGKTTLAANLACAVAQAGNRVILLDCDFRKPSQHRVFGLDKKIGLSNVLAGEAKIEEATQKTPIANLSVVPCGPIPANPSEILNSQNFLDLLDQLSKAYDLVLIDSPPVLPVTDARVLAASVDGVILALRAEKTTRSAAMSARDQIQSVGGRILGLVVNDVSRRRGVYSYYYADEGRYSYYHYGRRKPEQKNGQSNGASTVAHSAP